MYTTKRRIFLDAFLNLLGAESIKYTHELSDKIFGTVIYHSKDPDEQQDFCWNMTEENVPSQDVLNLILFIKVNQLINIDKIIIPFSEIFKIMHITDYNYFLQISEELMNVRVSMIDNGVEANSYFVHL